MSAGRAFTLIVVSAALLGAVPAASRDRDAEATAEITSPEAPVAAPSKRPAVSIVEPVGTVSLVTTDVPLGQARYAARKSHDGTSTVRFSRSRVHTGRGGPIAGGLPAGMPLHGARLTSRFGYRYHPISGGYRFHAGVDLAAARGTPIYSTSDGVVRSSGWRGGYGLMVTIDHGNGVETRYAHMSRLGVGPNQSVKRGQVIGYVGSTGRSTGPHLHYEVRNSGAPVDPLR